MQRLRVVGGEGLMGKVDVGVFGNLIRLNTFNTFFSIFFKFTTMM